MPRPRVRVNWHFILFHNARRALAPVVWSTSVGNGNGHPQSNGRTYGQWAGQALHSHYFGQRSRRRFGRRGRVEG